MEEKCYRKSDSIVYRKIGKNFILVPIRNDVADLETVFTLNDVSARIWELIDGKLMPSEIAKKLTEEFDVSREEAEKDVHKTLEGFKEFAGIVEAK